MLVVALLIACHGKQDTDPGLTPVDSADTTRDTDVTVFPPDTSPDSDISDSPRDTVTMHQWGYWDESPAGGPYNAVTGVLYAQEYLDGLAPDTDETDPPDTDVRLECDVEYSLVAGAATVQTCSGCDPAWTVQFTVTSGDPGTCHESMVPIDQQQMTFAYDNAHHVINLDYGDLGLWQPWYPARHQGQDRIVYEWQATVGINLPEDTNQ